MSKLKVRKISLLFNDEEQEKQRNEEEEKPVMPQTSETSEEVHGGNEITESIEDSENRSENQQEEDSLDSEEQEISESEEAIEEAIMQEDSKEREPENTSSIEEESKSDLEQETSEESESNNSEDSEEAQEKSDTSQAEESETEQNESQEENEKNERNSNSENDSEEDYEEDDYNDEDYEDDSDYEEDDDSDQEYQYNTEQVVDVAAGETISVKYLQTEFYRFLERFSEDKLKIKSYDDFEEWDIKKLMFRAYERKSLNAYRCTRIRDKTVLILDNSGSMAWWEENLRILSAIALSRDDVEVYIAPNGYIEEQLTKRGEIAVDHEKVMKSLQGRRIIYVGDFDGADTAIILSWSNDVVWICPENRYRKFLSHSWVSHDETKFKGVFIRAWTVEEMFKGLKMTTRFYRLWIDFHENDDFEDDY